MATQLRYLLITPAHNEEAFIGLTIQAVINQSIRPVRWLIVSDGSTDSTDDIVKGYAEKESWIELYRMPERNTRDFGGKAHCVNTGYDHIKHIDHDVIASLDADITFEPDYFEFLLNKFDTDSKYGLIGTPFAEDGKSYNYKYSSTEHVSGACQVFRRECFQEIGGYVISKSGGIDVIAVLTSRMRGWKTRTFIEKTCDHHRAMGSANHKNAFRVNFNLGRNQYRVGFHPLWQFIRSVYQLSKKPYIIGGLSIFTGYFWSMLTNLDKSASDEVVAFQRKDQMRRLKDFFRFSNKHSTKSSIG